MDFPLAVLQGLKLKKTEVESGIQAASTPVLNTEQYNQDEHCPLGCDPSRTTVKISKSGRKGKGNFVHVYYRGSGKIHNEVPLEVKQAAFWREFDELEERNKRSSRNRPQSDRRTDQVHPSTLFA